MKTSIEKFKGCAIEVLDMEHGKQVIDFWKSIGVNTHNLVGGSSGSPVRFYGLFSNGYFDFDEASRFDRIITLEEAIRMRDEQEQEQEPEITIQPVFDDVTAFDCITTERLDASLKAAGIVVDYNTLDHIIDMMQLISERNGNPGIDDVLRLKLEWESGRV